MYVCSLSVQRLSRRALSLLPPALHCVQDSMVLGEICFMDLQASPALAAEHRLCREGQKDVKLV